MRLQTVAFSACFSAVGICWAADPTITLTNVAQDYPWSKTVNISYNVTGVTGRDALAVIEAWEGGTLHGAVTNWLDGTGKTASQVQSYHTTWTPSFSAYKESICIKPILYLKRDYMIVDLDNWKVSYEWMRTQTESNTRYNTTAYKTSKLVLRKISEGSYRIGGMPTVEAEEDPVCRHHRCRWESHRT